MPVQFSQGRLSKGRLVSIECSWLPCQIVADGTCVDLFPALSSVPLVCVSIFVPVPTVLYSSFTIRLEMRKRDASHIVFLRIALAHRSLLWFRINFTIVFSVSLRKCHWTLDRAEFESGDGLGHADTL